MNERMLEHLQMLIVSAVLNPAFLVTLIVIYVLGRVLGRFMPWDTIVKPMVILFVVGIGFKLFVSPSGYDLYIMFGFPFIAGLWTSSRKRAF